ncbi:hypothetical protein IGI04_006948 [Brassica rapa subsp. trilocularis]|uniref:Uncharacterized protein n=1 Tax=Brassica rapa subsp. trilocularis TaxID=1813537 RepID=A0ABQ7NID9_BRACM|nr:hypothetical protein IGI04_006948 [Brassica rapa subsp. trilocularis]
MSKLLAFLTIVESNDLTLSRLTIKIQSSLERIFNYANCSPLCFFSAYIYLDCFTLFYNNTYYAKVGGTIVESEINVLYKNTISI